MARREDEEDGEEAARLPNGNQVATQRRRGRRCGAAARLRIGSTGLRGDVEVVATARLGCASAARGLRGDVGVVATAGLSAMAAGRCGANPVGS